MILIVTIIALAKNTQVGRRIKKVLYFVRLLCDNISESIMESALTRGVAMNDVEESNTDCDNCGRTLPSKDFWWSPFDEDAETIAKILLEIPDPHKMRKKQKDKLMNGLVKINKAGYDCVCDECMGALLRAFMR